MFETLQMAPADSILGLTEAFKKDSNPNKINLGVGVYKDAAGNTPVLESVKRAERILVEEAETKSYLSITGSSAFANATRTLLFGKSHSVTENGRAYTANTPGGTGALRVAGDFLYRWNPKGRVWLSNPTWANHGAIFEAAGLETKAYTYYDPASKDIDFDGMLASLGESAPGDVLLLHACCHNPSGVDLSQEQWLTMSELIREKSLLPLIDFAYQGFGAGLDEDAVGVRLLSEQLPEVLICSSYSKNFGLYQDRVGALTLVAADADSGARAFSQVEKAIRANYSNPPAHGSLVVTTILESDILRGMWEEEVAGMRKRINEMRALFVDTLQSLGVKQDFSFIRRQHGMFSFSGLNKDQVELLRTRYAIYIVGSGRISVAGMTEKNMPALCNAIADVL
ncbi:MAG: Aspartate aminotransferase [Candidatus Hydrogenedentes bacterium ADurb.Bin170]|nr:MAG: Aspartate aminotransferase [Candidatus Hydrogenedentes bacterium ADurb.Bin170]